VSELEAEDEEDSLDDQWKKL